MDDSCMNLSKGPLEFEVRDVKEGYLPMSVLPPLDPKLVLQEAVKECCVSDIEVWIKKMMFLRWRMQLNFEWGQLMKKKGELQKLFYNADKTVTENTASIARFLEIIKDHDKQRKKINYDTTTVTSQLEEYLTVQEMMEEYVEDYSVYERFLENVAADGNEFNSVRDILNRYETLELTRADCARILAEELEAAADIRKQMLSVLQDKANRLKSLGNELVLMQVRFKEAKDRRVHTENLVQKLKHSILVKEEEAMVLRGGIWDLYSEMCSHRKMTPSVPRNDINSQLNFIQKTISFYKDVNTVAASIHSGPPHEGQQHYSIRNKKRSKKSSKSNPKKI